ncbi:BlaI/MecI/CopY family transcriptional regulator [Segeticoccus rhizosphaerae]|uniref:BlaI/MecI/CopY family transcriptional regulator n=1 Tax=Segeticoccus rhizosphaerae TaxID=1104777 RepID=UPI0010C0C1DB|nr:BlaI/MecI/CopY family transcriptional regulator [Ornithinicoccus soli]
MQVDRGDGVRGFGELEAVVMRLVWNATEPAEGPGDTRKTVTVREIYEHLQRTRAIAYTTVMSTMDNLYHKGWLDRCKDGRRFRYWATASRAEYGARLMREALAVGGDTEAVLTHFIGEMSREESGTLHGLLARLGQRRPC